MKNIIKILGTIILLMLVFGCTTKKIEKLSYTEFNEFFVKKSEHTMMDNTSQYDSEIRRYLEVGEGNIQIFYIEFDNSKNAEKYLENYFKNDENNKVKEYENYTFIKSTKPTYMKLYKVDNIIIYGKTNNKKSKRLLNKTLKDLGY